MTPEWTPDAVGLHRWRGKARRRAARLRRRLQAHHPEVSLVVVLDGPVAPARDVLTSACAQSGPRLEVVAVVADARLLALAEAVAERDERVRIVEVPGSDRARARTMGAVAATAPWLLFLAPGTELLPGAVAALAQARGEGPWAVLGGLERRGPVPGGEAPPAWARTPLLARVLVDRDAWARCLDDGEPDGQTAATAVLSLGHAVVAASVVRDLAGRGADADAWTSTSPDPWAELSARVARDRAGLALLERPDQLRDRRLRAAGALERDLPPVLAAAELLPDRGWALLHHHAAELLEVAGDELATVPAAVRAAAGLAAEDRRDDLVALVARLRADAGEPPTRVEDGRVLAVTGGPDLTEAETGVDAEVREQVEAGGVLEVRVRAALRRVEAEAPVARVRLVGTGGEELGDLEVVRGAPDLVVRVPTERLGEARWHVEVTLEDRGVRRTGTARGTVAREAVRRETVRPPEPDPWHRALGEEADPHVQRRLREQVRAGAHDLDPTLVLLDAGDAEGRGRGEGTGDVVAVGLELARRLPDARVRWVVADPTAAVPAGAEPVVHRSAAWHAALATAAWVVTDRADVVGPLPDGRDDLDDWFVPRPGQQVVFTGAGHPSRAAGLPRWRRQDRVPSHVAQLLAVTSARWTTALVPVPELEQTLRDSWAYDGPVVAVGAPRLDAVLAPDRDDHRRAVRARLGVEEQQVAVLWATTCRDDVTGECLSASGGPGPDPARVARELGPDHVLLLLGPRCARHAAAGPGVRLVDLATHPDLALDLAGVVLASDVGVLDWSPLRFDLAAAGRPVVLWVPDLDDHVETDGLAFDLARSTAGPLVRTTEEVLGALADPAGLRRTWDSRRRELVGFFDRLDDGGATARVVDALLAPGPGGPA
ncbi:CDP-Glycerol:Poly(glycerophosphate) glycerophosphotransferase [Nocardioides scoriae]|uniref:CDP-Glycerol:Poly(Glycerophosphate) glycerophosphotransferase n=1 Tax=Nocardioides scoriae TaxID=642780 RepID=A0A1H1TZL6_9ACTN|nr:CDP-glycerol glycerophosphotransferase family protein [Nocardioides scoriae]SDS65511.1 CDP-Glycerol:Poly(glycerophosphate) glycerophosphotransferase [Nocardioides scoriae]